MRDRARHRAEDAQRRQRHDVVGQLKHHGNHGVHDLQERLRLALHVGRGDAEQSGENDDLKDVLLGHRVHDVGWEEMKQRLDEGLRLGERFAGRRKREALSGPHQVRDREAEHQGGRRRDLEIDESLDPHAAHRLDVAGLPDPDHDRREDEGHDQHLDQADERAGEEPEALVDGRMRLGREEIAAEDSEREPVEDQGGRGEPAGASLTHAHLSRLIGATL